jgi:hypothetical protein
VLFFCFIRPFYKNLLSPYVVKKDAKFSGCVKNIFLLDKKAYLMFSKSI